VRLICYKDIYIYQFNIYTTFEKFRPTQFGKINNNDDKRKKKLGTMNFLRGPHEPNRKLEC
jgi:hypothetical protein